jgi:hypothetical protein
MNNRTFPPSPANKVAQKTGLNQWNVQQALRRIFKKHGLATFEGKRALGRKFANKLKRSNANTPAPHSPPMAIGG